MHKTMSERPGVNIPEHAVSSQFKKKKSFFEKYMFSLSQQNVHRSTWYELIGLE